MRERVVVAMSGGVDSSVAAARLAAEGWDAIGVTLHLWDYPDDGSVRGRCCAPEDIHDARRVSDTLGVPHYSFDRRELFRRSVVEPFVDAYLQGTTPSPCVQCNRSVKMQELLELADRFGSRWVATGHYARIDRSSGLPRLLRGHDRSKDQSYFLHRLDEGTLGRMLLPLGESTKEEVRREAVLRKLPGANKGESQELCFVPTGRYDRFVEEHAPTRLRPGPIVDEDGRRIGEHTGIHRFTLGQRRNLGVAIGRRAYVTALERDSATVRLGPASELLRAGAILEDVAFAAGVRPPFRCDAVVRYRGRTVGARVERDRNGRVRLWFDEPMSAVVPGQTAVFYRGDEVLGGGTIVEGLTDDTPSDTPSDFSSHTLAEPAR